MPKRLILLLAATLTAVLAVTLFAGLRIARLHREGWSGMFYSPDLVKAVSGKMSSSPMVREPGEIIAIYSGTPARALVREGDRIVSVNGVSINDTDALRAIETQTKRGDTVRYTVLREGRQVDVSVRFTTPFASPFVLLRLITAAVVAATFVAVALIVFLRRRDDRRAAVFYAFAIVSAIAIIISGVTAFESVGRGIRPSMGINTITPILALLFTIAYAPLVLHLSLVFPTERPVLSKRPKLLRWVYSLAVLALLVSVVSGLLFFALLSDPSQIHKTTESLSDVLTLGVSAAATGGLLLLLHAMWAGRRDGMREALLNRPLRTVLGTYGLLVALVVIAGNAGAGRTAGLTASALMTLPLLLIGSYPVLAAINFIRSYRSAGIEERKQVQWPLWGLLLALGTRFIAVIGSFGAGILLSTLRMPMSPWMPFFHTLDIVPLVTSILIPLSFAAAILKYRLMEIDLIIRRTVAYAILSGAILFLYAILAGGIGSLLVRVAGLHSQTTIVIATLVVAFLFFPLRTRLQGLVDRNLFRHRFDYPAALQAIDEAGRSGASAPVFLATAAEKIQQALQNRSVVIFSEKQGEFVPTAKLGLSSTMLGKLRIGQEFGEFLDRPFDPRRRAVDPATAATLSRIDAALVVPSGSRAFLALGSKLSGTGFDVEDIDFLESASERVASAVERMRMQVEEADFSEARAIQQTLLPRTMPELPRLDVSGTWIPARTMGGDYYDLIQLGPMELAVCIGDVAGKGMPAALFMSGLQAAVRASATSSPRDLCERVRRVVVSSLSGGRFVTFFYAAIDSSSMRLRWCNAGHNPPVLARRDGTLLRLEGGGPAFTRLFSSQDYEERELELLPGDRLVMFTDGLSEATDSTGEMFGEPRVEQIVRDTVGESAAAIQERIVSDAISFCDGELNDDLTLAVVAVR